MATGKFIKIGRIVGAHGIKGYVKVEPLTDFLDRFKKGTRLRLEGNWVEVIDSSIHKGRPLILLSTVKDRNDAEKLQWKFLEAAPEAPPELAEDEYVTDDLIGLEVQTEEGEVLGEIDEVMAMPAHDVVVVGDILIPLVKDFVKLIDLENEVMVVRLIPGMRGEE